MTKILLILYFLFTGFLFSQKMPEDYLEEGNEKFYNDNFSGAISDFRFIIDNFKKSDSYPFALYNYAKCLQNLDKEKEAVKIYKNIIKLSFEPDLLKGTESIMENPYANFSYYSCISLAELYKEKKNYKKALEYYLLADTANLYVTFCGNEAFEVKADNLNNISECYYKSGDYKKVIKYLTPFLFDKYYNDETKSGIYFIKSLEEIFSYDEIKNIFEKSFKSLILRNEKYHIYLFKTELTLINPFSIFEYEFKTKEDAEKFLMQNFLFKRYLS